MEFTCLTKSTFNDIFQNILKAVQAMKSDNVLSQTVLDGFGLSHVLKPQWHADTCVQRYSRLITSSL